MNFHINNTSERILRDWNLFLKNHPQGNVFQSPEMYFFYEKVQNFDPYIFVVEDKKNSIEGVLLVTVINNGKGIKGFLSRRAVVIGGPLIKKPSNSSLGILDELLQTIVNFLKTKSIFIEFRNIFSWDKEGEKLFGKYGFNYSDRLNLLVPTRDEDIVWSALSESRKRQIKSALTSGVRIVSPKNEEEVRQFYTLLVRLYKKIKKPLPAWSFFREFYRCTQHENIGIIRIIKYNDQIIAGVLLPVTKGESIYEWYIVGLDNRYKKLYPSVIATWSAIDYALHHGIKKFDLMGLGRPDKTYGVRDFKLRFGGEVVNYGRYTRKNNRSLYLIAKTGYHILKMIHRIN